MEAKVHIKLTDTYAHIMAGRQSACRTLNEACRLRRFSSCEPLVWILNISSLNPPPPRKQGKQN